MEKFKKRPKKRKSFNKGIGKDRGRFILEERGSDEQEEKSKASTYLPGQFHCEKENVKTPLWPSADIVSGC